MTKPFLETDIIIERDPDSGTASYDKAKEWVQKNLKASDAAIDFTESFNPFLAGWFRGVQNSQLYSPKNHSPDMAEKMLEESKQSGADKEVNGRLNFGLFTHNLADDSDERNMSLNRIDPQSVIEQFASDNPDDWPNLLLNCNHARVASTKSVSGIMEGFHALASDCFRDAAGRARELNLTMMNDHRSDQETRTTPRLSKPSIILSAVFNQWNAWGNGATLIHRINHLDAVYEREEKGDFTSQREREKAYLGEGMASMSPASIILAKLMLALIVQDPKKITIPTREDFENVGGYEDDKIYVGDMTKLLANGEHFPASQPIALRANADKILQHILPEGYSKGGNIISDAVRFLMLDLQRPLDLQQENAPSLFEQGGKPLGEEQVAGLIHNLGVLAINPGCTPLNAYEEKMGMRRLVIANTRDSVIGHLIRRPIMDNLRGRHDGKQGYYEVKPKAKLESLGHGFLDALGRSDRHGGVEDRGYVAEPEKLETDTEEKRQTAHAVRSRLRVVHAACYNALGVSAVRETEQAGVYELEFSRGADSKLIEKITEQLQKIVSSDTAEGQFCDVATGVCRIAMSESEQAATTHYTPPTSKERLAEALKKLADPKRQANGTPELFVGDHVYHKLGAEPPDHSLHK